jgi:hypothetical protein
MVNVRLAFFTADLTPETVFTNSAGTITTITSITLAQPSTGVATVIRLTIGADGATTRWFEYQVPAGTGFYTFYPGIVLTGTETIQASSTVSDDVVVCTINGYREP